MDRLERSPIRWAIAASLALHLGTVTLLAVWPPAVRPDAPPQRGIEVDFVAQRPARPPVVPEAATPAGRAESRPADAKRAEPEAADLEAAHTATDDARPGGIIHAERLMSADVLADPRSRAARAALAGFGETDQMVQLCGIEAMEQVHAWDTSLEPDSVVAYAMAEMQIGDHAVLADGGAIRTGQSWFKIAFRCELAPDHSRVVAFRFRLGAPIPREEWEEHNLPDGSEPLE